MKKNKNEKDCVFKEDHVCKGDCLLEMVNSEMEDSNSGMRRSIAIFVLAMVVSGFGERRLIFCVVCFSPPGTTRVRF